MTLNTPFRVCPKKHPLLRGQGWVFMDEHQVKTYAHQVSHVGSKSGASWTVTFPWKDARLERGIGDIGDGCSGRASGQAQNWMSPLSYRSRRAISNLHHTHPSWPPATRSHPGHVQLR